jgi:tripartite-type tricarboxylate transporter receptor subunit TctC
VDARDKREHDDCLGRTLALALLSGAFALPAAAQTVDSFYRGRTVEMIVASDAATEYTRDARLLIRYLPKYIPGTPTIILRNMPGASGINAVNHLYTLAARDGSVLGCFNKGIPMYEATRLAGVQYKSAELNWLGSMSRTNSLVVTWHGAARTLAEARVKETTIGALGLSGTMATYPFLLNRTQGTKLKVVAGYVGSAEINLAMERGEVQGRGTYSWDFFKADHPGWRTDNPMNLLVQIGLEKEPDLPDVPLLLDLAHDATERAVYELISADSMIARPFVTTPGVPAERVAALRVAFDAVMQDREFLQDAAKASANVSPVSGARVAEIVRRLVAVPPAILETANEWMSPPK